MFLLQHYGLGTRTSAAVLRAYTVPGMAALRTHARLLLCDTQRDAFFITPVYYYERCSTRDATYRHHRRTDMLDVRGDGLFTPHRFLRATPPSAFPGWINVRSCGCTL